LSTGDFERSINRTLEVGVSLSEEAPWTGLGEGGSFAGDPGRYVKKGSRYRHLSPHKMLVLHPQSIPVFTVYAVCLQKAVHEAEFHCLN
jgi:hypothetical protein